MHGNTIHGLTRVHPIHPCIRELPDSVRSVPRGSLRALNPNATEVAEVMAASRSELWRPALRLETSKAAQERPVLRERKRENGDTKEPELRRERQGGVDERARDENAVLRLRLGGRAGAGSEDHGRLEPFPGDLGLVHTLVVARVAPRSPVDLRTSSRSGRDPVFAPLIPTKASPTSRVAVTITGPRTASRTERVASCRRAPSAIANGATRSTIVVCVPCRRGGPK
jgi:hypothetical protein